MQNISYEHKFELKYWKSTDETHFHKNGFTRRHALTQGQKATFLNRTLFQPFSVETR